MSIRSVQKMITLITLRRTRSEAVKKPMIEMRGLLHFTLKIIK